MPNKSGLSGKEEMAVAVSKANQRAVNKYVKNNYDRVNVTMPKGKKATIQAHAAAQGESVNSFINRAIDQTIAQDGGRRPQKAGEGLSEAGVVFLPSEPKKRAPAASEGCAEGEKGDE